MKLNFELVPTGTWYKNLRSILSQEEWDIVRKDAYNRANGKCMICEKNASILDAHETWRYDEDTHIQKLVDVRAVCQDCHRTIHIGLAAINGHLEEAFKNYCEVNNCSDTVFRKNYNVAFAEWDIRSKIKDWELDISWLKEHGFNFKQKCCPTCDTKLVINKTVGNQFYRCDTCDYKEPIICDICGKNMRIINGKNGFFLGCTGYPNCKNTRNIK